MSFALRLLQTGGTSMWQGLRKPRKLQPEAAQQQHSVSPRRAVRAEEGRKGPSEFIGWSCCELAVRKLCSLRP